MQVGIGKGDGLSPFGVDGKEADIRFIPGNGLDGLLCGVENDEFDADAEALCKRPGKVDRDAVRRLFRRVPPGQHGVAKIDRGTQFSRRGKQMGDTTRAHDFSPCFMK